MSPTTPDAYTRKRGLQVVFLLVLGVLPSLRGYAQGDSIQIRDTVGILDIQGAKVIEEEGHAPLDSVVRLSGSPWRNWCDTMTQSQLAWSAILFPGFGQIVNRDYWKLPIFYAGIGGFTYMGLRFSDKCSRLEQSPVPEDPLAHLDYQTQLGEYKWAARFSYMAAMATYSLSVVDALYCHETRYISPVTAMVASALMPGLGQVYTHQFWKVPVIYGAGIALGANLYRMSVLTDRFDQALTYLLDEDPTTIDEFEGKRTADDLKNMRNYYERWRDFNTIMLSVLYVLNVLDAYVGAHLYYWNVNDNLAFHAQPAFVPLPTAPQGLALSMQLQLKF